MGVYFQMSHDVLVSAITSLQTGQRETMFGFFFYSVAILTPGLNWSSAIRVSGALSPSVKHKVEHSPPLR